MASATIPELIEPGVLYVPSPNNFFSVASSAMPNTDDALLAAGSSGTYRAYQPAIDGIHYSSDPADPMSILWWARPESGSAGGSASNSFNAGSTFLGVMDADRASSGISSNTTGIAWGVSFQGTSGASDNNSRRYSYIRSVAASSIRQTYLSSTMESVSSWSMTAQVDDGGSSTQWYRENAAVSGSSEFPGTPGTPGALADPYFAIGPYSTVTGWATNVVDRTIGKITLWNRVLTAQEVVDLYDSMMSGPPSP